VKNYHMLESEMGVKLLSILSKENYPSDKILLDYEEKIGIGHFRRCYDCVVLASDGVTPLVAFEFKGVYNRDSIQRAIQFLIDTKSSMAASRYYTVFPNDNDALLIFDVTDIVSNNLPVNKAVIDSILNKERLIEKFDTYSNIDRQSKVKTIKRKEKRREKIISGFNILCWIILPIMIVSLLVIERIGLYDFTNERLIVIGVLLVIIMVPFFNEISVKDISIKRRENADEKEDN